MEVTCEPHPAVQWVQNRHGGGESGSETIWSLILWRLWLCQIISSPVISLTSGDFKYCIFFPWRKIVWFLSRALSHAGARSAVLTVWLRRIAKFSLAAKPVQNSAFQQNALSTVLSGTPANCKISVCVWNYYCVFSNIGIPLVELLTIARAFKQNNRGNFALKM